MFMTREHDICPGEGCVVNAPITTNIKIPESLPHSNCVTEVKNLAPPPPSLFDWPEYSVEIAKALIASGYEHTHKPYYPQMYFTGYSADLGRESVEAYFKPGPRHAETPTRFAPTYPHSPTPQDIPSLKTSNAPTKKDGVVIASHPSYMDEESSGSLISLLHMGPFSQGPKDCVHGGAIATSVDVLMYRAVMGCGVIGVTANLNVNYRNVIPIGQVVVVRVNVPYSSTRKVVANFGIFSPDHTVLYAEGSGLFIRPKEWDQNPDLILSKKEEEEKLTK